MPTVHELKHSLGSGGNAFAPLADRRKQTIRDAPPKLVDHNEAEWRSTMEFIQRENKRTRPRADPYGACLHELAAPYTLRDTDHGQCLLTYLCLPHSLPSFLRRQSFWEMERDARQSTRR